MNTNELIQLIEQKVRQKLSEVVNKRDKRYSATIQLYVYAENDNKAKQEVEKIISELNRKYDNNSRMLNIYSNEFGSLETKKVK
jgi:shikimate kinase